MNRMMGVVVSAVILRVCGAFGAEAPVPPPLPGTIGPYLQNPASDAMTVCFLASSPGDVTVAYGLTRPEKAAPVTRADITGTPWTVYKSRISGLEPGKKYRYAVTWKNAGKDPAAFPASFTTLNPNAPAVKLIVFNDLHNLAAPVEEAMKHIRPEDYEGTILLGDCWADPRPDNNAERVFRLMDAYVKLLDAAHKPMLLLRGNHECRKGFSGKLAMLFDMPHLDGGAGFEDQRYYFGLAMGPVYFACADCGEDMYKKPGLFQPYREKELEWLRGVAREENFRKAPWRVFASHIGLYTDTLWCNSEPSRRMWEEDVKKMNFHVAIAGHAHKWGLLKAGQTYTVKENETNTVAMTPPFPVLVGGGTSVADCGQSRGDATVMLFKADKKTLNIRLMSAGGKELMTVQLPEK
jgi:predicted phosphodiesterase